MMGSTKVTPFQVSALKEAVGLQSPVRTRYLVSVDPASQELFDLMKQIAPSDAAVQITGETGTGKELVARQIHEMSGRSGPFVAVNCGAINEQLADSELFGHESGSFTGATSRRAGWFEAADGGTLFLDEIGDLPLPLQGKLLRVLQEGEVTRVGSRRSTPVDVRIISATNVDLAAAMVAGSFRQDLFYRLHIVPVRLLPLRERAGDIKALAEYFIVHYSRRLKRLPPTLHQDALDAFTRYSWPGNIRELENVIYFSLLVDPTSEIRVEHLRLPGDPASRTRTGDLALVQGRDPLDRLGELLQSFFTRPGANLLRDIERRIVADAFRHCDSNQVRTAELLGVSRNVIRRMLKCHGLLTDGESGDDDDAGAPVDVLHYFGSSRLAEAGVVRRHSETEEVLV